MTFTYLLSTFPMQPFASALQSRDSIVSHLTLSDLCILIHIFLRQLRKQLSRIYDLMTSSWPPGLLWPYLLRSYPMQPFASALLSQDTIVSHLTVLLVTPVNSWPLHDFLTLCDLYLPPKVISIAAIWFCSPVPRLHCFSCTLSDLCEFMTSSWPTDLLWPLLT
jgi:hypothetical protein